MEVTQTGAEGLRRDFRVVIPASEIDTKVESRLRDLGRQVRLPGFRPGKVPLKVLRQRYQQSVMGEVLEEVVSSSSRQILEDEGLRPAMQPDIKVEKFEDGTGLEFSMAVETLPEVAEIDLAGFKLERPVAEPGDKEVEEALGKLAENATTTEAMKTKRAVKEGDIVRIDFHGTVDGEAREGMAGEGRDLEMGSGTFLPDFEAGVIGMKPGEEKTFPVGFPEDYGAEELRGKTAEFTVKAIELRKKVKAGIDDALAERFGFENLDKLKEMIRERLEAEFKAASRARVKRALLDKLAEDITFEVPARMVEAEFEAIWKSVAHDREHGHVDPEDEGKSEEEMKADYRNIAERRVRLGLILSDVGTKAGVQVGEEELRRAMINEARRYPGQEQQVIDFYRNNPQALDGLRAPLFEEKVVDYILEMAQVKDKKVSPETLMENAA